MAVGDPNQAIYGWRGASVSNILNFADTFPAADGEPGRLPLTVNRRSDRRILDVANRLAEPLLAAYGDKVARLRAAEIAAEGHVETHVFERAADELAWLATEVQRVHDAGTPGPTSACSAATTPRPRRSTTPSPRRGSRSRSSVSRPDPAARGRRGRRHADAAPRRHGQLLDADAATGPRWAIGPRDLRLLAQRAAEVAGVRGRRRPRRSPTSCCRSPTASTPPSSPRSATPWSRRARRRTPPRRSTASACWPPSCVGCAATSATRCSTSCAGSSTPPASTWSWRRRPRRPPPPGATTSTCS